ncbi:hypothetical protein CHGG_08711 [Chaetomium globosum CBS 148.51]|uniref:HTH CENPB-type domain-containing protein n=1 Tax=Chaetomium globosum (strain ATCC 6205 / CBS 148.51 / DSM 1962 / NBRC 6347 / NRRL 1970) TaxID=306901 RepID=Q2GTJ3_CHAGB|nr:uncharacterized protein CHGG_08711 [Chaetomium globosum CBS 148.51]EAQ84697.1 hypothetical protein CHGG_08711 [Chaetomium globosum CBS 148.51]
MHQRNDEVHVQLALQAMQNDTKLSARAAGKIYNVDHEKLSRRRRGMQPRRDIPANSRKLTDLEESIVVQYILDLDSKGFPPRLCGVEDMANGLLAKRDARRIGTRWASNFVKRQPDLTMRFNRKYDYQRALCENPDLIRGWFALVQNTIAKYGIQGADIYNFDEIGFLMGVISTILVVTGSERRGRRKTRQPGNRKWSTVIQGINARGWAIPPFIIVEGSYHLSAWHENSRLPQDWITFYVRKCPLKAAYGKQIEEMMRASITHITKEDFFPAFLAAHQATMTYDNIRGGFRGAGLVPFYPEEVISQLDIRLKTPTPPNSRPGSAYAWVSKTPNNPI